MINPFSQIDLSALPPMTNETDAWFNPDEVEIQDVHLVSLTDPEVKAKLLKAYVGWEGNAPDVPGAPQQDVLFNIAPTQIHCNEKFIRDARLDSEIDIDMADESCVFRQYFGYALLDEEQNPLGVITGNFSVSGNYNINTKDKTSKEMWVSCEIDVVEVAPEYRGKGLGKELAYLVTEAGSSMLDNVFETIPEADIKKLNFTPRVSAEIYSQSGNRWFEHLTQGWEGEMLMLLSGYVNPSKINSLYYDAGM